MESAVGPHAFCAHNNFQQIGAESPPKKKKRQHNYALEIAQLVGAGAAGALAAGFAAAAGLTTQAATGRLGVAPDGLGRSN